MTAVIATLLLVGPFLIFVYLAVQIAVGCHRLAEHLNLRPGDRSMYVDQKLPLTISPTDAAGAPAPVTDIHWSAAGPATAAINTTTPDLLNAELVCDEPGTVLVTVTAKAADGLELTETVAVEVQARPVIATKLNLAIGEPEPRA